MNKSVILWTYKGREAGGKHERIASHQVQVRRWHYGESFLQVQEAKVELEQKKRGQVYENCVIP